MVQDLRHRFGGLALMNAGFGTVTNREDTIMLLTEHLADTAVDCPVIANPDPARRWQEDLVLKELDYSTFYSANCPELAPIMN